MEQPDRWWLRPVRMMRRDYIRNFAQFARSDLEALAREARERWHVNCEWVMATPGCSPGMAQYTLFRSEKFEKFAPLGDFDMLRAYLPHARAHGIRLLAYVNMHWYSYDFAAQHPGWEQMLEDGIPYGRKHPLYGDGTTLCINSPWRDWAMEMIREVMRTGVDGVFLDGPVMFPGCCYCDHCRRLFREATGHATLPHYHAWGDPVWSDFLEFRSVSWARFMRDAYAAVREVNPDGAAFLNGGAYGAGAVETARSEHRLEPFQTFTGAEEFFHCHDKWQSPFASLNLARYLSAGKNPAVVFTHHALSTWHYAPLPESEMAAALAQTTAGGANTWFAIFMQTMASHAEEAFRAVEGVAAFQEQCDALFTGTQSAAETAALFSNQTIYHYITRHTSLCRDAGSGREKDLVVDGGGPALEGSLTQRRETAMDVINHESHGCLDVCTYNHIPVRVVWDNHLAHAKLKDVRTLILPGMACLSQDQIQAVTRHVEAGGALIATFEAGMYGATGEAVRRADWLRFLGIAAVEGAFVPSRNEDYLTVASDALPGFARDALIPRPLHALRVRPTRDAEVLALYNNPVGKVYEPLQGVSKNPAILLARRGKGRVVYCASPLFDSFDRFHIACHQDLARALLQLAAGKAGLQVETDAPGSLAVEVRKAPGRVLVHLVNVTSDMKRPMGPILPLRNVRLRVRAARVTAVRALRAKRRLAAKSIAGRIEFTVPVVGDYEVVLLETGR